MTPTDAKEALAMHSLKKQMGWCTRAQYILAGAVFVVALIFWLMGYRPQIGKMQHLMSEIGQTQRELDDSQKQAVHLPDVAADLIKLKTELADYQRLPSNPELGEFMSQITDLSHKSGLSKIEVEFSGSPQHFERYSARPVQLKFDGDFINVFAFLRQAESMPRLTRISNIAIRGSDLKSGQVHVDVTMALYFAEG
jgi:Tfp pilus assembly protein PilO